MTELLTEGQVFATRYRVERFLAKGGFGAVYVAEQLATELRVALKVLWPHVLQSTDAVEKFQQEARIAGRVNSEHIVRVIDAGFDAETGMPFLVMELLDGMDLDRVVREHAPLQPAVAAAYLRQVASGLDKAHRHVTRDGVPAPIVHRDLKPENLFLCRREDGSPLVKVLDFGIAKILSESTKMSQDIKGTPLYMASEQLAGGAITPRTDVWALGLIAFFLMSGKDYWKTAHACESTLMLLMGEMLTSSIDPPSARLRELGGTPPWPPGFDDWFLRCVSRDADQRFASAGEATVALAAALESSPRTSGDPARSETAYASPDVRLAEPRPVVAARTLPSTPPPAKALRAEPRSDLGESLPATVLPLRGRGTGLLVGGLALSGAAVAAIVFFATRPQPATSVAAPIVSSSAASPAVSPSASATPTAPAPAPPTAEPSALPAPSPSTSASATPAPRSPKVGSGHSQPTTTPAAPPRRPDSSTSLYGER
ncbi:MAG: protein kinase [Sorangiineae bacterium]|nr:protein kinase [Sorangiineae bacterium]